MNRPQESSPPIAAEAVEAVHKRGLSAYAALIESGASHATALMAVCDNAVDAAYPAIWHSFEEALLGEEVVEAVAARRYSEQIGDDPADFGFGSGYNWDHWRVAAREDLQAALQAIRGEQGDG